MCTLLSNGFADACLAELPEKKKRACENKYAILASQDSVEVANGLWNFMHSVSDWSMHAELKSVRKVKSGRHRLYLTGRHTDCHYTLVFMLVNKRDEDDNARDKGFQRDVINALSNPQRRVIPVPDALPEPDAPDV